MSGQLSHVWESAPSSGKFAWEMLGAPGSDAGRYQATFPKMRRSEVGGDGGIVDPLAQIHQRLDQAEQAQKPQQLHERMCEQIVDGPPQLATDEPNDCWFDTSRQ